MLTLVQRLQRNSFWKLIGDGSRGLLALFFILVARHYGPEDFGRLTILYSITLFATIVADLGLNQLVTRQIAAGKERAAETARGFLALKLLTVPLWLVVPAAAWIMGKPDHGHFFVLLVLLSLAFAGRNLLEFFGAIFTGLELIHYESALKFLAHVLMLAFGGVAVLLHAGIYAAGAAMLAGYLCGVLLGAFWCHRSLGLWPLNFRAKEISQLYAESLPLILMPAGLSVLTRWDMLLLGYFGTPAAEVGWYSASERVVGALGMLSAIGSAAAYPVLSDLHANDHSNFLSARARFLKTFFVAGAAFGVLLMLISKPLTLLAYGPAYAGAAVPLAVLAMGLAFSFPNAILLNLLVASGRSWDGALSVIAACVVNIGSNLVVIPQWGMLGAAGASVLGQAALLFAGLMLLRGAPRPAPVLERVGG
ncbi:MAG: flippase [Elusimicrobia bacterium]|nr:flippase [Elusimicrobiota bacterium]